MNIQMKQLIWAAALPLAMVLASPANSILITRNVEVDLSTDKTSNGFEGDFADALLNVGDTFDLWITFANREHLEVIDTDGGGNEFFNISILTAGTAPALSTLVDFNIEFSTVMGDLLVNPVIGQQRSSQGGFAAPARRINLTDTSFTFHDLHASFTILEGSSVYPESFNEFRVGIIDADLQRGAWPVSEPATLALFGLGLAGLGSARRKKA
jgi:hypothetical protein